MRYKTDLDNVDWQEMKSTLAVDRFDHGRTPKQLQESFDNSYNDAIEFYEKLGFTPQAVGLGKVVGQ